MPEQRFSVAVEWQGRELRLNVTAPTSEEASVRARRSLLPGARVLSTEPLPRPGARYDIAADDLFEETYRAVEAHTLIPRARLSELWSLVGQIPPGDLLEVGVWRGGSGCLLAKRLQLSGSRHKAYLCDTFAGTVKAGTHDTEYSNGEHADASPADVAELIDRLELANVAIILHGVFPDDNGGIIEDRRFALCHIDVDIYWSAKDVVEWVWPRLVPGGGLVYDDYRVGRAHGITRLVDERRAIPGSLTRDNGKGQAIVSKL